MSMINKRPSSEKTLKPLSELEVATCTKDDCDLELRMYWLVKRSKIVLLACPVNQQGHTLVRTRLKGGI